MANRYELTRPITKEGNTTFYWDILKKAERGLTYNRNEIDRMGKYMTFQALVEAGLLINEKREYVLTSKGQDYIKFYEKQTGNFFKEIKSPTMSQAFDEMMGNPIQALNDLTVIKTTPELYSVSITTADGSTMVINNVTSLDIVQ